MNKQRRGNNTSSLGENAGSLAEAELSAGNLRGLSGDDPEDQLGDLRLNEVDALLVKRSGGELADLLQLEDNLVNGLVLGEVSLNVLNEELAGLAIRISQGLGGLDGLDGPGVDDNAQNEDGGEQSEQLVHGCCC